MQHFRARVTFSPNGSGQAIAQSIALSEPSKMGYRVSVTERCNVRYRKVANEAANAAVTAARIHTMRHQKYSSELIQLQFLFMSCSKPLPPFTYDLMCFWNREQLERFSVVCRSVKNFADRYFHSKPYRIFKRLSFYRGSCVLLNNRVNWQPNHDDYSAQQFLAGQKCPHNSKWYSLATMHPYLGPTIRIKWTTIFVGGTSIFNPEHIAEMESIAYLWRDSKIFIRNEESIGNPELEDSNRIIAEDCQAILNSPTILQCRELNIINPYFPFKDYKVLYTVKRIRVLDSAGAFDLSYWQQFIEQPGVKPLVVLHISEGGIIDNALDHLKEAFSSAVFPNSFKVVFIQENDQLTEFREINNTSGEKLEFTKGLPTEYQSKHFTEYYSYTLERSSK